MNDAGFKQLWSAKRGHASGFPDACAGRRASDVRPLDALRQAVIELEVVGRELTVASRIEFCDRGGVARVLARYGLRSGDGFYLETYGGVLGLPEGTDPHGEARPVWHHIQPRNSRALGMLFLHYSPETANGAFAEVWRAARHAR